tara:strand:+ start:253 stop:678 length:426 start_codon:yes stop_codon:yes gene_type:complete
MKNLLFLLIAIPSILFGQQDVPEKYWLDDSNYEDVINGKSAFGDDDSKVVVVEYWAKFNEANCYPHWKELADDPNIDYYRVNIANAPVATKKYRVRMAPTMFIIFDGIIETKFKAGLDLEFPADKSDVEEAIKEAQSSDKF